MQENKSESLEKTKLDMELAKSAYFGFQKKHGKLSSKEIDSTFSSPIGEIGTTKISFNLNVEQLSEYRNLTDDFLNKQKVYGEELLKNKKKRALITGITGQDGSYLAEFLLEKGYEVHGITRRSSHTNTQRIDHIFDRLELHYGDITDASAISNTISKIKPHEIYNLAAQSHVQVSFSMPNYTGQVDAIGTLNILEAVKNHSPNSKIYQASTSELFGGLDYNRPENGYNERSSFHPRSPYGVAKLYGYWICKNYKEAYNMFISNGILFNHGSPRRGINFIEKKIIDALVNIKLGKQDCMYIGNLYAKRDIGYAKEYVQGMYLMLQQERPDDFVLSTGEVYTIKDMINLSAEYLNVKIDWSGAGAGEVGIDKNNGKIIVQVDEKYLRPSEVDLLVGDSSKAKNILGWEAKTKLPDLLKIMIDEKLNG